jgi:hypothetical protein
MKRSALGIASAVFLLSVAATLPAQTGGAAGAQRAILVDGAFAVKGLPFFPPNALSALTGRYRPDSGQGSVPSTARSSPASPGSGSKADAISVWYTRETLVMDGSWRRTETGGAESYVLARPQGPVIVQKSARFYLFFEFPAGASPEDRSLLSFISAFDRKFLVFFSNAATDAELSFPAYVDY